ncbi:MAG: hypothetical protein M2R45_03847 [Verrucomicrobia subdivision 3 bacterium]|nr:hypothetical protein [Limisphaerales bacterium]MCS1415803.1 hypothetical protein [Limisphaerales bacterium]
MIRIIDDHLGTILSLLKQLYLEEKTEIFFSNDNGPSRA